MRTVQQVKVFLIEGILKETSMSCQSDRCRFWSNASLLNLLCGAVNFAKFVQYLLPLYLFTYRLQWKYTDKSTENLLK